MRDDVAQNLPGDVFLRSFLSGMSSSCGRGRTDAAYVIKKIVLATKTSAVQWRRVSDAATNRHSCAMRIFPQAEREKYATYLEQKWKRMKRLRDIKRSKRVSLVALTLSRASSSATASRSLCGTSARQAPT